MRARLRVRTVRAGKEADQQKGAHIGHRDPEQQPDSTPPRAHEEGGRRLQRPRRSRDGCRASSKHDCERHGERNDPYPIQFGSGDWITVVSRVTGTFTGEMLANGKVIPPTGKAFDVEFAQTTKWDGDLLIEISAFWDSALQAKQIGLA
jgi:hypothetical protein